MGVKDSFIGRLLNNADKFSEEQVTQTITLLIEHAVKHRASDIHIEPHERFMLVRYRIDGSLRGTHKLPVTAQMILLQQLKILAHLNPQESMLPQEGHYATLVGEDQFEVQVNTLPVLGGEKAVLHISRRLSKPPTLERLGFWGQGLHTIGAALSHTHGLIVVATPRRNGKTTTLHSILQALNTPTVSIATVENAIEYQLAGVSQTKIRPHQGITFYQGLQAALNQDPNIVMISSLTDKPTAGLAIQAAAAGHLVIAGVHADNAAAALAHLRAMTDESFLLATAIRVAVSQRLLRQLCPDCRERYIPSQDQIAEIEKTFGTTTPAAHRRLHELEQQAAGEGVGGSKYISTDPSHILSLWRASDDGCEKCNRSGYRGSVAITETLGVHEDLQQALFGHTPASKLHTMALAEGYIPMGLDGLVKALRGETTISEVIRTLTL
jgi:type II secretory ATPase GspE/PulE/Tfp pilus assembly ATPase PilB-like protein